MVVLSNHIQGGTSPPQGAVGLQYVLFLVAWLLFSPAAPHVPGSDRKPVKTLRVLVPTPLVWCLATSGNTTGVRYRGAPCQRVSENPLHPWCWSEPEDPCGELKDEQAYTSDGNCQHTDPQTGESIPAKPCEFEFEFTWEFTEPCTGVLCSQPACCNPGTIADAYNNPLTNFGSNSFTHQLPCGMTNVPVTWGIYCSDSFGLRQLLSPGYILSCADCD